MLLTTFMAIYTKLAKLFNINALHFWKSRKHWKEIKLLEKAYLFISKQDLCEKDIWWIVILKFSISQ